MEQSCLKMRQDCACFWQNSGRKPRRGPFFGSIVPFPNTIDPLSQSRSMTSSSSVRSSTIMVLLLRCAADSGNLASHDLADAAGKGMTCPAAGKSERARGRALAHRLASCRFARGARRAAGDLGSPCRRARPCFDTASGRSGIRVPILAPARCWLVGVSVLPAGRLNIRRPACHAVHGRVVSGLLNR